MTRKIISLFLILCLWGCQKQIPEETVCEEEYIDPLKDVFIFDELDDSLKEKIKKANCNNDYKNYQFEMLGKGLPDQVLTDIIGNEVDLKSKDRFYLEVVSVECSHCRKQLGVIADLVKDSDIPFIQYFNVGNKEEILDLYADQNIEIPEKLTVISEEESMKDYVKNELGLRQYPTLIAFDKGKAVFTVTGEIDEESFEAIEEISYKDPLDMDLIQEKRKLNRSVEDLIGDLSEENIAKLEALDHDDYSRELTYQLMGKKLDFNEISNRKSEVYINQIDDFSVYEDKKPVLIYTYLRDNSEAEKEKVKFINELISGNDDVEFIVVLIEGMESSSAALKNMDIGFGCPVVSVLGRMPDDFFRFGLIAYPTAVFVDKGTFTGAYSDIESKEKLAEAIDLFLSDESIAYKRNN
jgi:thiol-disulfide isomerase/thioredoxin